MCCQDCCRHCHYNDKSGSFIVIHCHHRDLQKEHEGCAEDGVKEEVAFHHPKLVIIVSVGCCGLLCGDGD